MTVELNLLFSLFSEATRLAGDTLTLGDSLTLNSVVFGSFLKKKRGSLIKAFTLTGSIFSAWTTTINTTTARCRYLSLEFQSLNRLIMDVHSQKALIVAVDVQFDRKAWLDSLGGDALYRGVRVVDVESVAGIREAGYHLSSMFEQVITKYSARRYIVLLPDGPLLLDCLQRLGLRYNLVVVRSDSRSEQDRERVSRGATLHVYRQVETLALVMSYFDKEVDLLRRSRRHARKLAAAC